VRAEAEGWSPADAGGSVFEANVVEVDTATMTILRRLSGGQGAILLVHSDERVTLADLFNAYLRSSVILEHPSEARMAILWTSGRERLLLYYSPPNSLAGDIDKIPQASWRGKMHALARTVAANPWKVRARFDMPNKIGGLSRENGFGRSGY